MNENPETVEGDEADVMLLLEEAAFKLNNLFDQTPNPFFMGLFKDIGLKCIRMQEDGNILYNQTQHLQLYNSFLGNIAINCGKLPSPEQLEESISDEERE